MLRSNLVHKLISRSCSATALSAQSSSLSLPSKWLPPLVAAELNYVNSSRTGRRGSALLEGNKLYSTITAENADAATKKSSGATIKTIPVGCSRIITSTSTSTTTSIRSASFSTSTTQSQTVFSKRKLAELEDRLWSKVGSTVQDPVLGILLSKLQWINRRIAVSQQQPKDGEVTAGTTTTIQMLLKLPSLLHPSLDLLKQRVQQSAQTEVEQFLAESSSTTARERGTISVNVEAIACPPVPIMARLYLENDEANADGSSRHEELMKNLGPGLASVAHFVAVYSCKGGVGKSTVAVNLAYELAHMGGRVGVLDLDLYGPSLPVLIKPDDLAVRRSSRSVKSSSQKDVASGMILPIEHHGVKALSFGFVSNSSGAPGSGKDNGAAIMRGPMAGKVVTQLLKGTDWGELDVLVLDLPPGTGDVQLQVLQDLQVSGAVAVTTPSKLAAVDTRKGIEMFTSLGVPTIAVVENMSYFECDAGKKYYPFGKSIADAALDEGSDGSEESAKHYGSTLRNVPIVQLPISGTANDATESGVPLALSRPEAAAKELSAFNILAKSVCGELLRLQYGSTDDVKAVVVFDWAPAQQFDMDSLQLVLNKTNKGVQQQPSQGDETFTVRLFGESGAVQRRVPAVVLRSRDPKTGEVILESPFKEQARAASEAPASQPDPMVVVHKTNVRVSPSIIPRKVEKKGRYGYAIEWADGATVIYSNQSIATSAGGTIEMNSANLDI